MSDFRITSAFTSRRSRLSRRTTIMAGGLSLGATVGLAVPRGAAQQGNLPQVLADFVAAWETLDPDQIADLYAEDGTAVDVPAGTTLQGREAIRAYLTEFIGAFDGASVDVPTTFASEGQTGQAAMEWIFTGTYTGALPGFPPGEGQAVTLHGFSLVEFSEDAIERTVDFYDIYGILVQLGVVPGPTATPAG